MRVARETAPEVPWQRARRFPASVATETAARSPSLLVAVAMGKGGRALEEAAVATATRSSPLLWQHSGGLGGEIVSADSMQVRGAPGRSRAGAGPAPGPGVGRRLGLR
uniref:Uncharacterized protein n=1 Tax=Malurus cyaneus samueli TaxID=2593467 RepID=A0A8C5T3J2_9PASS